MKKLALIAVLLVLSVGMVFAGGGKDSENTVATSSSAEVEKVFKISTTATEDGDDKVPYPWRNPDFVAARLFRFMFLAEPDLITLQDDLVKADYTVSEDGLVYTFEFIEGGVWSDGTPITPKDIEFSIKTLLKVAIANGIFTTAFNSIEGSKEWKAGSEDSLSGIMLDGNTVKITLSSPYSSLPSVLAQLAILPEHALKNVDPLELHTNEFWSNPVTSGAYKLGEFKPGNYYTLVKNEYYTGTIPKIDKIIMYFVADSITSAQAEQVYFANSNSPDVISEYSKLGFMEMFPIDILFYRYFIVNMEGVDGNQNTAMQDIKVRQALLYAIEREELASGLFPDIAHILHSGIPSSYDEYNDFEYDYNPEKAKQLLEEADYDFDRPIRILYYYTDQTSIDFLEAIAYYLGEVGLKVELVHSQQGTTDLFSVRNYDIGYKGLSAFAISEWYGEYASTNANFQNIFGGDPAFDDINRGLATATSNEERSEILKKAQELEQELLYKIPLYTIGNNIFVNTKRVKLPDDIVFGNPWYRTDVKFEEWELID